MTRIGFAIMDPTGGGAHYRGELPARVLRAAGHEVVVGETVRFASDWRLGLELDGTADYPHSEGAPWLAGCERYSDEAGETTTVFVPDVLVVTAGWSLGFGSELLGVGRQAGAGELGRSPGQVCVVDFDDGLDAPTDNAGFRADQVQRKVMSALGADRLTCSTPVVARDLVTVRRPTAVVRNMIDRARFVPAHAVNQARLAVAIADRETGGEVSPPVLGFRGPLPWHRADVEALRGAVEPLVALGCRIVHIGAREDDVTTFAELVGVNPARVEVRPQVPFAEYPDSLAGVDIGLVPFARRAWSSYKSNIGGLEWNAAGVPWLASDQPEYRKLHSASVVAGRFGWAARVRELLEPKDRYDRWHQQHVAGAVHDVSAHVDRAAAGGRVAWGKALGLE